MTTTVSKIVYYIDESLADDAKNMNLFFVKFKSNCDCVKFSAFTSSMCAMYSEELQDSKWIQLSPTSCILLAQSNKTKAPRFCTPCSEFAEKSIRLTIHNRMHISSKDAARRIILDLYLYLKKYEEKIKWDSNNVLLSIAMNVLESGREQPVYQIVGGERHPNSAINEVFPDAKIIMTEKV